MSCEMCKNYEPELKTWIDFTTNLEWEDASLSTELSWQSAKEYAKNLGDGWRLPTIKELFMLIDYTKFNSACTKESKMRSFVYWSSTTHADYTYYAWYVNFGYGSVYYSNKSNNNYVRCVRAIN